MQKFRKDEVEQKQKGKRQKDNADWNRYLRKGEWNESEEEDSEELRMIKVFKEVTMAEDDECVFLIIVLLTNCPSCVNSHT